MRRFLYICLWQCQMFDNLPEKTENLSVEILIPSLLKS
jgi:hypothetical protein